MTHHDPTSDVIPPKAPVDVVWVEVGVGVAVVGAMTACPPFDGTLNGTSSRHGKKVLERFGGVVRAMCPEAMITSGDT